MEGQGEGAGREDAAAEGEVAGGHPAAAAAAERALRVGVDVGGTWVRLQAFDAALTPVGPMRRRAWAAERPSPDALAPLVASLWHEAGLPPDARARLGIALAGQLDAARRTLHVAPNLGWREVDLASRMQAELGARVEGVVLINDVQAALLGEHRAGALRGHSDALALFVGTGVGGALLVGGEVLQGSRGCAGELGHVRFPGRDERCGCGATGCLDALAGGAAITRRLAAAFPALAEPTLDALFAAADTGDTQSTAFAEDLAGLLAAVVAPVLSALDTGTLLVGGGVLQGSPRLCDLLEWALRARLRPSLLPALRQVPAALGDRAGVTGAAVCAGDLPAAPQ